MTWSLRPTLWSSVFSGFIPIGLPFRSQYSGFSTDILYSRPYLSVIDVGYSESSIIGLLYLCSILSGFSLSSVFWLILRAILSMQYGGNSIAKLCYQLVLFGIVRRFIQPEVPKMSIFWLLTSQLEGPTYSASYLNLYKFRPCPLCVQFTPYRNWEDAIFCKVDGL